MRSIENIIYNFPVQLMQIDEKILFSEELDTEEKSYKAAKYLNINIDDFNKIPFQALRLNYLLYKYILLEVELYEDIPQPVLKAQLEQYRTLADKAYELLLNSEALNAPDRLSPFSQGVSEFYQRSPNLPQYGSNDLSASIIPIGPKRGGIEPGFMCQQLQDDILVLAKKYNRNIQQIREHIKKHKGKIELAEEEKTQYMIKMDYRSKGSDKVSLNREDIQRTATSQKAYKKSKFIGDIHAMAMQWYKSASYIEKSIEALMEALTNDIASMFMPAQSLVLIKTAHQDNGKMLKLMPKVVMIKDSEEYGSVLCGGGDDTNNYRARKLLIPQKGIETVTDDRIRNEAEILIPLLFTGDYDKVGSKGQNLLVRIVNKEYKTGKTTYEIIGIDYGHAFQRPNPVINSLLPDASFEQPSTPFKNYSALADASLSEVMRGAFFLAKLAGTKDFPNIDQYEDERFAQRLSNIRPNEIEKVINDYISVMTDLANYEAHHDEDCTKLIKVLQMKRKVIQADLIKFHNKFSSLIAHSPIAIDLADNLKKLCAAIEKQTSLRSLDEKHGLKHLRINSKYPKKFWNIQLENNVYSLSVDLRANKKLPNIIEKELKKWANNNQNLKIELKDNQIFIQFHKIHLAEVAQLFAENKIKMVYHKEDYLAIKTAYQELKLQDLLGASWFLEKHLTLDLMQSPNASGCYRLVISATGHPMNAVFMESLQKIFSIPKHNSEHFTHDFTKEKLNDVYHKLLAVQENYEFILAEQEAQRIKEERLAAQRAKINLLSATLAQQLSITMTLAENSEAQIVLNFQGPDLKELQDYLTSNHCSYILLNEVNNSELFISPANLTILEKQLMRAPLYFAEKREQQKREQQQLLAEQKQQQRLAELKINSNCLVEPPMRNKSNPMAFFTPIQQYEPEWQVLDNGKDDPVASLFISLQQYQGYLSQTSPGSSYFSQGWCIAKKIANYYTNDNSSAALLDKLNKYDLNSSNISQSAVNTLQEDLRIRQNYIMPWKESRQEELQHLDALFMAIDAVKKTYSVNSVNQKSL